MDDEVFFIVSVSNHNCPADQKAKDFGYILKLNSVFNKKQAVSNKHDVDDIKGFQKNIFGFKLREIQEELIEVKLCIADPENTEIGQVNLPTSAFKLGCYYKLDLMFKPSSRKFTDINVHLNILYSKKPNMKNTFKNVEWSRPNYKLIKKANTFSIFQGDLDSHGQLSNEKLLAIIGAMQATSAENWKILGDPVFLIAVNRYIQKKSTVQIFQPSADFIPKYSEPKPSNVPTMSILPNPTGFSIPRQRISEIIADGGISRVTVDNIRKAIIEGQDNEAEPEFPEIPDYVPEAPKPDTSGFNKPVSVSEALGINSKGKNNNSTINLPINSTINMPINSTINTPINPPINPGAAPTVTFDVPSSPVNSGALWVPQNTGPSRRAPTPSAQGEIPPPPDSHANNMNNLITGSNPYGDLVTQAQPGGLATSSNPYGDLRTEAPSGIGLATSSNPYGDLRTEVPSGIGLATSSNPYGDLRTERPPSSSNVPPVFAPSTPPPQFPQAGQNLNSSDPYGNLQTEANPYGNLRTEINSQSPYGNLTTEAFQPPPGAFPGNVPPNLPDFTIPSAGPAILGASAFSLDSTTASTFNPDE